jgi:large subunit ribosomal protein L35
MRLISTILAFCSSGQPICRKIQLARARLRPYIARSFEGKRKEFMRRPKGIKTRKSFAKRFKITATGKVMRSRAGKRHLLQGKSAKRRRSLRGGGHLVHKTDMKRVLESMPFSHRG